MGILTKLASGIKNEINIEEKDVCTSGASMYEAIKNGDYDEELGKVLKVIQKKGKVGLNFENGEELREFLFNPDKTDIEKKIFSEIKENFKDIYIPEEGTNKIPALDKKVIKAFLEMLDDPIYTSDEISEQILKTLDGKDFEIQPQIFKKIDENLDKGNSVLEGIKLEKINKRELTHYIFSSETEYLKIFLEDKDILLLYEKNEINSLLEEYIKTYKLNEEDIKTILSIEGIDESNLEETINNSLFDDILKDNDFIANLNTFLGTGPYTIERFVNYMSNLPIDDDNYNKILKIIDVNKNNIEKLDKGNQNDIVKRIIYKRIFRYNPGRIGINRKINETFYNTRPYKNYVEPVLSKLIELSEHVDLSLEDKSLLDAIEKKQTWSENKES